MGNNSCVNTQKSARALFFFWMPCSNSGCSRSAGFVCVRCKDAQYCSEGCQEADWEVHSTACRVGAAPQVVVPPSPVVPGRPPKLEPEPPLVVPGPRIAPRPKADPYVFAGVNLRWLWDQPPVRVFDYDSAAAPLRLIHTTSAKDLMETRRFERDGLYRDNPPFIPRLRRTEIIDPIVRSLGVSADGVYATQLVQQIENTRDAFNGAVSVTWDMFNDAGATDDQMLRAYGIFLHYHQSMARVRRLSDLYTETGVSVVLLHLVNAEMFADLAREVADTETREVQDVEKPEPVYLIRNVGSLAATIAVDEMLSEQSVRNIVPSILTILHRTKEDTVDWLLSLDQAGAERVVDAALDVAMESVTRGPTFATPKDRAFVAAFSETLRVDFDKRLKTLPPDFFLIGANGDDPLLARVGRAWRSTPWFGKMFIALNLAGWIVDAVFDGPETSLITGAAAATVGVISTGVNAAREHNMARLRQLQRETGALQVALDSEEQIANEAPRSAAATEGVHLYPRTPAQAVYGDNPTGDALDLAGRKMAMHLNEAAEQVPAGEGFYEGTSIINLPRVRERIEAEQRAREMSLPTYRSRAIDAARDTLQEAKLVMEARSVTEAFGDQEDVARAVKENRAVDAVLFETTVIDASAAPANPMSEIEVDVMSRLFVGSSPVEGGAAVAASVELFADVLPNQPSRESAEHVVREVFNDHFGGSIDPDSAEGSQMVDDVVASVTDNWQVLKETHTSRVARARVHDAGRDARVESSSVRDDAAAYKAAEYVAGSVIPQRLQKTQELAARTVEAGKALNATADEILTDKAVLRSADNIKDLLQDSPDSITDPNALVENRLFWAKNLGEARAARDWFTPGKAMNMLAGGAPLASSIIDRFLQIVPMPFGLGLLHIRLAWEQGLWGLIGGRPLLFVEAAQSASMAGLLCAKSTLNVLWQAFRFNTARRFRNRLRANGEKIAKATRNSGDAARLEQGWYGIFGSTVDMAERGEQSKIAWGFNVLCRSWHVLAGAQLMLASLRSIDPLTTTISTFAGSLVSSLMRSSYATQSVVYGVTLLALHPKTRGPTARVVLNFDALISNIVTAGVLTSFSLGGSRTIAPLARAMRRELIRLRLGGGKVRPHLFDPRADEWDIIKQRVVKSMATAPSQRDVATIEMWHAATFTILHSLTLWQAVPGFLERARGLMRRDIQSADGALIALRTVVRGERDVSLPAEALSAGSITSEWARLTALQHVPSEALHGAGAGGIAMVEPAAVTLSRSIAQLGPLADTKIVTDLGDASKTIADSAGISTFSNLYTKYIQQAQDRAMAPSISEAVDLLGSVMRVNMPQDLKRAEVAKALRQFRL